MFKIANSKNTIIVFMAELDAFAIAEGCYRDVNSLTFFNVESAVSLQRNTKAIREGLWACAGCCIMGYKV